MARFEATLLTSLKATEDYYTSAQAKVNDLGLWGSTQMAREIRDWRAKNFATLKETITSFILSRTHRDLLAAADTRLAQIRDSIRILKLEDNEDIAALMKKADASLAQAKEGYDTLEASFNAQTVPEKPLEIVKASLDALGDTYQTFFDLSEAVKKVLPRS